MPDNKFKGKFKWEEKIPKMRQKGYLFRNKIFVINIESYKIMKISISLSYDFPKCYLKASEGMELLSGLVDIGFEYSL